jgi:hypothetical protein
MGTGINGRIQCAVGFPFMKPSSGIRNRGSQLARCALSLKPGRDVRVLPALAFARTGDFVRHLETSHVAHLHVIFVRLQGTFPP